MFRNKETFIPKSVQSSEQNDEADEKEKELKGTYGDRSGIIIFVWDDPEWENFL